MAQKRQKDLVDQIRKEEREAIEAEERRRETQRHASSSSGAGGSGQKEKDAIDSANGAGMGRRQQSTEGSFHRRRASTGARVGPAETERRQRLEKERSNGQPRRFEQIRQSRVEDTLTDFFGL